MRVPLSWLKDFVDLTLPPEKLAERLTLAGLEVAHIIYIGVPQGAVEGVRWPKSEHLVWDDERVLLGAIREVKPHPDADKLVLAMVDYGGAELEQCVTGAPNLFAYSGQGPLDPPLWTAFAKEGAVVWDGHSDTPQQMTLRGKDLRGIYNKSMVCSEKELGISEEHEGILLMDHDPAYVPGTPLSQVLGDVVLDIELTPNLGHGYSVLGVAREVAALTGATLRQPETDVAMSGPSIEGQVMLDIRDPERNPRFTLALLRDTEIKPSPFWMRYRLQLVGQRPINNIVDITNYVTFEIGQPLHAFDYDKLVERAGGPPTIITRLPEPGETLTTLDDVVRELGPDQILVADTAGVLSLGGIMGGEETEVSDETRNVLLEAAAWNFINIRRTAQAQKIFTEAGTRFSRNVHPSRALLGLKRGIRAMQATGGGTIADGLLDSYPNPPPTIHVTLPMHEVTRLTGLDISQDEAVAILRRLLFEVREEGDVLHVTAPDYRTDISEGVVGQADLVEEIVRIYGYDNIPDTIMADEMPEQRNNTVFQMEERLRDLLVALGLQENISYRFTTPEREALLTPSDSASALPEGAYVMLANPVSADKTALRQSILTALLDNATRNARFARRQQVFEVGSVYAHGAETLPNEMRRVGVLMMGERHDAHWTGESSGGTFDFFDIKGVIEGFLNGLHITEVSYEAPQHSSFHPGRAATIRSGEHVLGTFGELHPLVALNFELTDAPVMVADLDFNALMAVAEHDHAITPLPITPAVLEDIALVVPDEVPASRVEAVIREAGGDLLREVRLFDVYHGESIKAGHKSLAYALTYQTDEKTLKDKDVAKVRKAILKATKAELNAELRS